MLSNSIEPCLPFSGTADTLKANRVRSAPHEDRAIHSDNLEQNIPSQDSQDNDMRNNEAHKIIINDPIHERHEANIVNDIDNTKRSIPNIANIISHEGRNVQIDENIKELSNKSIMVTQERNTTKTEANKIYRKISDENIDSEVQQPRSDKVKEFSRKPILLWWTYEGGRTDREVTCGGLRCHSTIDRIYRNNPDTKVAQYHFL